MNIEWEYMTLNLPKTAYGTAAVDKLFNDVGSISWELVTIIHHPTPKVFDSVSESPFFAIFKRQKPT